ncbi:MAG: MgtC/SapB family protein [Steroidobacteraceae bacterium]|nr:MgtC/SapB family protein [Steroidobacteraceae bacterium]
MASGLFGQLATSLLLGLLVGLQRQRTESSVGGIRTFPLIAAFGTLCGWLAAEYGGWIIAAGLVALAALLVVSNFMLAKGGDVDAGQTTEVSALLLYGIGAYLVIGEMEVAVALGGAIALLLHYKQLLHAFAAKIGERDVTAIMQFVLVTLVILPVLPDRTFGPYQVLNPFEVWLMVALIVGIGLAGYFAYKVFGARAGAVLGGLLGGLISSTATTVSFARRSAEAHGHGAFAALVIVIAATTVFVRVLTEIAVVAPGHFVALAPPIGAMLGACALIAGWMYWHTREHRGEMPEQENPADLRTAILFGLMYAVIIFAVAATKDEFGERGLYAVAILSGLTDMDAITLSTSQLANQGRLDAGTGWRLILVASMANLAFKAGMVAVLGSRELLRHVGILFGAALVAGGAILVLWP